MVISFFNGGIGPGVFVDGYRWSRTAGEALTPRPTPDSPPPRSASKPPSVVFLQNADGLLAVGQNPLLGLLVGADQLLHRDGVVLVEVQVDGVDAAVLVLEIGVVRDGPDDAQRPVVQELLNELVAQQRGRRKNSMVAFMMFLNMK